LELWKIRKPCSAFNSNLLKTKINSSSKISHCKQGKTIVAYITIGSAVLNFTNENLGEHTYHSFNSMLIRLYENYLISKRKRKQK